MDRRKTNPFPCFFYISSLIMSNICMHGMFKILSSHCQHLLVTEAFNILRIPNSSAAFSIRASSERQHGQVAHLYHRTSSTCCLRLPHTKPLGHRRRPLFFLFTFAAKDDLLLLWGLDPTMLSSSSSTLYLYFCFS